MWLDTWTHGLRPLTRAIGVERDEDEERKGGYAQA